MTMKEFKEAKKELRDADGNAAEAAQYGEWSATTYSRVKKARSLRAYAELCMKY